MAQVAQTPELTARIEGFLDYALEEWASVPQYAEEFVTWGEIQQLDFMHEWGIRESVLESLRDYATQELLTPEQCARYEQLLALVAQHRPTVVSLLAE